MSAEGPVEGPEAIRLEILAELRQHVEAHAGLALAEPAMRDGLVKRVISDVADCFQLARAAANVEAATSVSSAVYATIGTPLKAAGLGAAVGSLAAAGRRVALRRLKAPEAMADLRDAAGALPEASALVDTIATGREVEAAVATGLRALDSALNGGLPRGEVTLLGAATGAGKTTIALQIADVAAERDEGLVFVVSPEMRAADLWLRLAQRRAGVARREIRPQHPAHDGALEALTASMARLAERPNLVLLDRVDADLALAIESARLLHEQRGPLLLCVLDYAQQLASQSERSPRYLEVGRVASEALELAKDTGAAVLVTSQVNLVKGKRGETVDVTMRESQLLEHKAAVSMVLTARRSDKRADVMLRKNRHGPLLKVELYWKPDTFTLADLEDEGEIEARPWP